MNPVLYWNAILLEASRRDFTRGFNNSQQPGPIRTARAMAIVHLAIHDAVAFAKAPGAAYMNKKGFAHGVALYAAQPLEDVIDGAAVTALKAMYPNYGDYFDDSTGSSAGKPGFVYGATIGAAVVAMRVGDGSDDPARPIAVPQQAAPHPTYGEHRADPFQPGQNRLGTTWGDVKRFCTFNSPDEHKWQPLSAFPGAGSPVGTPYTATPKYKADFVEVRDYGAVGRNKRTAEQERIGVFWGYDGAMNLGVPPRLYNQIVRKIVMVRKPDIGIPLAAELFALANVAMADAGIDAWHHKYVNNLWRPVVGLREDWAYDGDAFWAPLGAPQTNVPGKRTLSPNFPAYPSGHATFGAALFQAMRLFWRPGSGPIGLAEVLAYDAATPPGPNNDEKFEFVSDELDGIAGDPDGSTRTKVVAKIGSYAQGIWENAVSRVYLGVHWRFDGLPRSVADPDLGGATLGLKIGKEAFDVFNAGPDSLGGSV